MKKCLSLRVWIEEIGKIPLAKCLKIDPATVGHWSRGWCLPSSENMKRIVKLSRGKVSYESMIEDFFSPSNKNNRRK